MLANWWWPHLWEHLGDPWPSWLTLLLSLARRQGQGEGDTTYTTPYIPGAQTCYVGNKLCLWESLFCALPFLQPIPISSHRRAPGLLLIFLFCKNLIKVHAAVLGLLRRALHRGNLQELAFLLIQLESFPTLSLRKGVEGKHSLGSCLLPALAQHLPGMQ